MECDIFARQRGKEIHYTVNWSALCKADRWSIAKCVPAVGGVYELYWMDERRALRLHRIGSARYGGLRSELRRLTDSELIVNAKEAALVAEKDIWYRYACTNSAAEMADVVWFLTENLIPGGSGLSHSGRYAAIALTENSPDALRWIN